MTQLAQLIHAISAADLATAASIVQNDPSLVNQPIAANPAGGQGEMQTFLHMAMPGDGNQLLPEHVQIVSLLLDHGAHVDAAGHGPNHGICTPLTLAAWGGHAPLIGLLVEHGADPNGQPERQPMRTAAKHGHKDAVEALIRAGADYDFLDLLAGGLTDRIGSYLDHDQDAINQLLRNGSPPLHAALDRETPDGATLASLLLERGSDLALRDAKGRTALHVAIDIDNHEAIELLRTALDELDIFAAAGLGESDAVAMLLRSSADHAHATQRDGVTPLFYAAHSGCVASARALLDAGADLSPRSPRFWACIAPLHIAIMRNHMDVAQLLLDRGADVDMFDASGVRYQPTALQVAARWRGIEVVGLLLDHGANMYAGYDGVGDADKSVLRWVLLAGQLDILHHLFDRGLDLHHASARLALHVAAAHGHADLIQLLIENGADPTARDGEGRTPREVAQAHGRTNLAKLLE